MLKDFAELTVYLLASGCVVGLGLYVMLSGVESPSYPIYQFAVQAVFGVILIGFALFLADFMVRNFIFVIHQAD